ncbi:hypothetical protein [Agrococcus baldri]|nr:hypothetical protein [Agrococcus baldri]
MHAALPEGLRDAGFAVAQARSLGMTSSQLRSRELPRPFRGARALRAPASQLERAQAFAPLLRPWQALAGLSALAVLGLPVPWRFARSDDVEVLSATGRGFPKRAGVRVRRIAPDRLETRLVEGVRVASPSLVWAQLAQRCTVQELVMLGDAIVSEAGHYPNRRLPGPLASIDELAATARRWSRSSGAAAMLEALERVRPGVESPRETDMRLFITGAGLPEPEVQVTIVDPSTGRTLGRADLLHRDARVVEEYEGDGHREQGQWDRDIQKYREFERIGLHVVRATNRDFVPSPEGWLADLAAVLQRRGSTPVTSDPLRASVQLWRRSG